MLTAHTAKCLQKQLPVEQSDLEETQPKCKKSVENVTMDKKGKDVSQSETVDEQRLQQCKSSDTTTYRAARHNLKKARESYRQRVQDRCSSTDTRSTWQGAPPPTSILTHCQTQQFLCSGGQQWQSVGNVNSSLGAEGMCSTHCRVLIHPKLQSQTEFQAGFSGTALNSFYPPLSLAGVPKCLRSAIIVPEPKKTNITSMNDCWVSGPQSWNVLKGCYSHTSKTPSQPHLHLHLHQGLLSLWP